jgi:group I intron endonuclease
MIDSSGVYIIKNTKTGSFYIGSSKNISTRWYHHKRNARLGSNKSPHLYSAMRKYGIDAFECTPLILCEIDDLERYEQYFLDKYATTNECYNVSRDATAPMRRASVETRKKLSISISNAMKGKPAWNKGIPRTSIEKTIISNTTKTAMQNRDNRCSENTKKIISDKLKGRVFSEETKQKMSQSRKGKSPWNSGVAHPKVAKLTADQVIEIRKKYVYGVYGISRLAKEYNVNPRTIEAILKYITWKHI